MTLTAEQQFASYSLSEKKVLFRFGPPAIVFACMVFNLFLCILNTHVMAISPAQIIVCELVLTAASVALGFYKLDKLKLFWLIVLCVQMALLVILSVAKAEILAKSLRDVIILPIFIVLGLTAYRMDLTKFITWSGLFVLVIALFEAFLPEQFLSIANIRNYFIAKGAMEDVRIMDLDFFASGERPNGRFLFDLPGIHRVSSVFLEPVSLGFFACIAGLYFIASRDFVTRATYITGLSVCMFLIWLSDARMALSVFVMTLIMRPVFRRIDHRFSVLILPLFILAAFLIDRFDLMDKTGEGLGARLHVTVDILARTNLDVLLGISRNVPLGAVDSGVADILTGQGILGLLIFVLAPILFVRKLSERPRIFLYGLVLYISFGFMVSPAIFSIKTAALLWFTYGYLIARDMRDEGGHYRMA